MNGTLKSHHSNEGYLARFSIRLLFDNSQADGWSCFKTFQFWALFVTERIKVTREEKISSS